MNRRTFLRHASILSTAAVLVPRRVLAQAPAAAPAAAPASGFTEFRPLRRHVGLFTGRGGTIGWLSSPEALAIVDTQFPDTAAICLAGLPGRNGRKIDVVLNTHHHFDHTSGNPTFKAAAKTVVAQANVPKLQFAAASRTEQDPKGGNRARLDQQVYADTTFTDVWRHEFKDEVVTAHHHGPAHTGGDAIVVFEKANVIHMGDLVFNRMYPVIDRQGGASVKGWIKVLEEAVKTYPADAIYIFGHGNPKFGVSGQRNDLLAMRDFWSALLSHVEKQVAAGKARSDVVSLQQLPGFEDYHQPGSNRLGVALGAAYDELTEKKA